ncbi:MAG: ParB/RepB/Spo0J family partition protein [Erysipelotrichaceae bacterium]
MVKIVRINIDDIEANANQPRSNFDENSIKELANSISENGLIQPIVVRKLHKKYQIIAGERRYRALKFLNREKVEVILLAVDDNKAANIALVENLQRMDLSPIEEALAIQAILANQNLTQKELAITLGKSQSAIANKLRLLSLAPEAIDAINNKAISERHGRALLSVNSDQQVSILQEITAKNLNVAQTEALINKPKKAPKKAIKWRASKQIRLGVNTINEAIKLVENLGMDMVVDYQDSEEEYIIEIKFKK